MEQLKQRDKPPKTKRKFCPKRVESVGNDICFLPEPPDPCPPASYCDIPAPCLFTRVALVDNRVWISSPTPLVSFNYNPPFFCAITCLALSSESIQSMFFPALHHSHNVSRSWCLHSLSTPGLFSPKVCTNHPCFSPKPCTDRLL
jgi:hypothetical protein